MYDFKYVIFRTIAVTLTILISIFLVYGYVNAQSLEAHSSDIIDYEIKEDEVLYSYQTKTRVREFISYDGQQVNEDLSKRTGNSLHFLIGKNEHGEDKYIAKIYRFAFVEDEFGTWREVELATSTIEDFNNNFLTVSFFQKIFGIPAFADNLTQYSATGDGIVFKLDNVWSTARNASSGTASNSSATDSAGQASWSSPNYYVNRMFLPFDTSSISDGATISAASLFIWPTAYFDGDSSDLHIIETTQAATSTLVSADFDNIGSTSGGSTSATLTTDQYNEIALNATGIGWIKDENDAAVCGNGNGYTCLGIRNSRDIDDSAPTGLNQNTIYLSEQAGTDNDPYLYITYSLGGGGEGTGTTTPMSSTTAVMISTDTGIQLLLIAIVFVIFIYFVLYIFFPIKMFKGSNKDLDKLL